MGAEGVQEGGRDDGGEGRGHDWRGGVLVLGLGEESGWGGGGMLSRAGGWGQWAMRYSSDGDRYLGGEKILEDLGMTNLIPSWHFSCASIGNGGRHHDMCGLGFGVDVWDDYGS